MQGDRFPGVRGSRLPTSIAISVAVLRASSRRRLAGLIAPSESNVYPAEPSTRPVRAMT